MSENNNILKSNTSPARIPNFLSRKNTFNNNSSFMENTKIFETAKILEEKDQNKLSFINNKENKVEKERNLEWQLENYTRMFADKIQEGENLKSKIQDLEIKLNL